MWIRACRDLYLSISLVFDHLLLIYNKLKFDLFYSSENGVPVSCSGPRYILWIYGRLKMSGKNNEALVRWGRGLRAGGTCSLQIPTQNAQGS